MRGGRAADMSLPRLNTSFAEGTPSPVLGPCVCGCVSVCMACLCARAQNRCVCVRVCETGLPWVCVCATQNVGGGTLRDPGIG